MLKEADNPPARPLGVTSVRELAGDWWVAHTKSRAEKAFAWDLRAREVPYYLPLATREAVWGGRRRRVVVPVFPGYVFFCGDAQARHAALATNRLCQVIPVRLRDPFVDQLAAVERAVDAGLTLEYYPFAVTGRRCRVRSGALMGLTGTIVRDQNKARLVLEVAVLGQGAALEVAADLLEPID